MPELKRIAISVITMVALLTMLSSCGTSNVVQELPEEGLSVESKELVSNGGFEEGLESWNVVDRGGSHAHGENNASVTEGPEGKKAVRMERSCPERDGGASGVEQPLDSDLIEGATLRLGATVRSDLEVGGAIAGSNAKWHPECAVQIRIFYVKPDGVKGEWYHGFYYGDVSGADSEHFTRVNKGEWHCYDSSDISGEIGAGAKLTGIKVYGFGWDFDGCATDLSLTVGGG